MNNNNNINNFNNEEIDRLKTEINFFQKNEELHNLKIKGLLLSYYYYYLILSLSFFEI